MKKLILAVVLCGISGTGVGAPFLVCDETTGTADQMVYQEGTATPVATPLVQVAPSVLFSCKADMGGFSTGTHNLQVWFNSTIWGVVSAKVPFSFVRPAAAGPGPSNPKLVP